MPCRLCCVIYISVVRHLIVDEYDGEVLKKSDAKDREVLKKSDVKDNAIMKKSENIPIT